MARLFLSSDVVMRSILQPEQEKYTLFHHKVEIGNILAVMDRAIAQRGRFDCGNKL